MIVRHKIKIPPSTNIFTRFISEKSNYTNTVLLPKTKLPLRLEGRKLVDRDNLLSKNSQFTELYSWQRVHLSGKEFILHDGPPYANGVPHMGHAINKILKDVILRTKILQGKKVQYIPGWDCHGLPIELKAVQDNKQLNPLTIRQKARNFASQAISQQKEAFLSWGVTGDWNNAYTTYHSDYIKNQIRQFYDLYVEELIYRDVKPVYWSPTTQTALAEAELEYNPNHKSTAVTVKVKLLSVPFCSIEQEQIYALIWTTTPWTLPSNQAICYNPKLAYSLVKTIKNTEYYIIASSLIQNISEKLGTELQVIQTFEGTALKDLTYINPIYKDKILKFLPGVHAVETKGTGLVHTAPAHGPEDYLIALENGVDVLCMVDENGKFTSQAGPDLNGLFVLSDGTKAVINLLGDNVVHVENYIHSYPYDWRTNKPVILRASKQWFINTNLIKHKALELLGKIEIIPKIHGEVYRQHFSAQLQKRPYWCISRQRSWGVPIPVFYTKDEDDVVINKHTIEAISRLVDKDGCDFWWKLDAKDILGESSLNRYNINNIRKGEDILDIWFDSGLSWSAVLPDGVADLYLEGVDQLTGWFQSSLLTSTSLRDRSPYKTIYIHGFAVDENGKKMSKSLGNVINPQDIMTGTKLHKAYGVDALRWWVACHANQDAIAHVSKSVLQASSDEVQKIRSVLRFAVAALYDYENVDVNYHDLKFIDKYLLHLMLCFHNEVQEHLNYYHYHKIKISVTQLLTTTVSALYYTSIKDRLYCDPQNSLNRKSAQYVLNVVLQIVTRTVAPILPHLAEELHNNLAFREVDSFFKTNTLDLPQYWYSDNVEETMNRILHFRKEVNKQVDASTLDKNVIIYVDKTYYSHLKEHMNDNTLSFELSDIFQVASVEIIEDDTVSNEECKIKITRTNRHNCPRCRRYFSCNPNELCYRCSIVLSSAQLNVAN